MTPEEKAKEPFLTVHDIRNKLTPLCTLISALEDDRFKDMLPQLIDKAKENINYLAQIEVYKPLNKK